MGQAINFATNQITSPVWLAEFVDDDNLLPGAILLDPAQFVAEDGAVVTASAGAAIGATTIAVNALANAIPSGTFLNFGTLAPVTVTVDAGGALANATSVTVAALSGPIPLGTVLYLGAKKFAKLTANAAAGATTLTVEALPTALAGSETATFAGGTKQARLTAAAAAAATSLTVDELEFAILTSDTATYTGAGIKKKSVQDGTYVGRTYTERDANTAFGPAASGDDERFLIAFGIPDLDVDATATAVRHQALVKENFLPQWATISVNSGLLAALRADYQTTKGVA